MLNYLNQQQQAETDDGSGNGSDGIDLDSLCNPAYGTDPTDPRCNSDVQK